MGRKEKTPQSQAAWDGFRRRGTIFEGPTVEQIDDRFDYGDRVYAIGLVNGLEITLNYADTKSNERRIISAWRSERHERRHYWQSIEGSATTE